MGASVEFGLAKGIQTLNACRTADQLQNIAKVIAAHLENASIKQNRPVYQRCQQVADNAYKFIDFANSWKIGRTFSHSYPKAKCLKKIACMGSSLSALLGAAAQLEEWRLVKYGRHGEKLGTFSSLALAFAYFFATGEFVRRIIQEQDPKKRAKAFFKILPTFGSGGLYLLDSLASTPKYRFNQITVCVKLLDLVCSVVYVLIYNSKQKDSLWNE
jgi:hypothetical protein